MEFDHMMDRRRIGTGKKAMLIARIRALQPGFTGTVCIPSADALSKGRKSNLAAFRALTKRGYKAPRRKLTRPQLARRAQLARMRRRTQRGARRPAARATPSYATKNYAALRIQRAIRRRAMLRKRQMLLKGAIQEARRKAAAASKAKKAASKATSKVAAVRRRSSRLNGKRPTFRQHKAAVRKYKGSRALKDKIPGLLRSKGMSYCAPMTYKQLLARRRGIARKAKN